MNEVRVILKFDGPSPTVIYLFKVNKGSTRRICKICSQLTIKTPE